MHGARRAGLLERLPQTQVQPPRVSTVSLWKLLPENPEPQHCLALGSSSSAFLTTYLA